MSATTASNSGASRYDLNLPPNPLDDFTAEERRAHERTLDTPNQTSVGSFGERTRSYRWRRLDNHNRDAVWKYRDDVTVWQIADTQYKIGTVFAFGLQLGMSKFLIQKAINWLMVIDVPKLGLNLEEVAFCVCGVVVNQNAEERYSDGPLYNPHRNDENNPETFVQLVNRIIERFERASMTRIQSCWGKLTQSELPERKAQHWRQTVEEEALVPLLPPETRRHFTAKELDG